MAIGIHHHDMRAGAPESDAVDMASGQLPGMMAKATWFRVEP